MNYPEASDGVSLEIVNIRCRQVNPSTSPPTPPLLEERGTGGEAEIEENI